MNEDKKEQHVQRSVAVIAFPLIGIVLMAVILLFHEYFAMYTIILFVLLGTALCVAGSVYAVLCNRKGQLTGTGIAGVMLSAVGTLFGILTVIILGVLPLVQ